MRSRARALVVSSSAELGARICEELGRISLDGILTTRAGTALRIGADLRPVLVIFDLEVTDLDGPELLRVLRALPGLAELPAIWLGPSGDFGELQRAGFSATLAKPPAMQELTRLADALVHGSPGQPPRTAPAPVLPIDADPVRPELAQRPPRPPVRDELQLHRLIGLNERRRERLASQSVELAFLAGFGIGISSGADADRLLDEVLARCAEVTGFRCGAAYLALGQGRPILQGQVGFPRSRPLTDFFGDPELLAEAVRAAEGGIARVPSERLDPRRARLVLRRAGLSSLLVAPVHDGGELLGVLVLGAPWTVTTANDEQLITAIAAQVGRWLSRVRTLSALSRSQRRTVERLARAAEFRDEETANHTQRVSRYCTLLAQLAGLDDRRSQLIGAASMMHDIGKLGIPDSILRKPGALNVSERRHMQRHADYGRKILAGESDPLLDLASVIAWTHHERWDGAGYPRQMRAETIPLEGRIVAVGDVFDALTSDRVYRAAMPVERALGMMRRGRGTHFDPDLLDLFMKALPRVLDIRRRHPDRTRVRAQAPALSH